MHVDILLIINYSILFPWYYAMATGRCEETPEVSADRNPFSCGAALWNPFKEITEEQEHGENHP